MSRSPRSQIASLLRHARSPTMAGLLPLLLVLLQLLTSAGACRGEGSLVRATPVCEDTTKTRSALLDAFDEPSTQTSALSASAIGSRLRGGAREKVLVTGGVGYIGSHTVLELIKEGYEVVVIDNLSNSNKECLRRVEELAGRSVTFHQVDIRDKAALADVFSKHRISAVVHFAGLKAVGESVAKPLLYYQVNVEGTLNLLEAMQAAGCRNIVFSSSATVYGEPVGFDP
eukprot:6176739-Pleurochrysis_carterae.AAC.1